MRLDYLYCLLLAFLGHTTFSQSLSKSHQNRAATIAALVLHLPDSGSFDAAGLKSGAWKEHEFLALNSSMPHAVSYDSVLFYDSLYRNYLTFLRSEGMYEEGKKNGFWKTYSNTSDSIPFAWRLRSTVVYEDGKREGWDVRLGSDSSFSKTYYTHGVLDSTSLNYYPGGVLATVVRYKNGHLHGTSSFYYENGALLTEIVYRNDSVITRVIYSKQGLHSTISGKHVTRYGNGRIRTEGVYNSNGLLDGFYRSYYANGNPEKEIFFVKGEINGLYRSYYENGAPRNEMKYVKGKPWEIVSYHSTKGKKLACGSLKNGAGTVMDYNMKNKLVSIDHYEEGRLIEREQR